MSSTVSRIRLQDIFDIRLSQVGEHGLDRDSCSLTTGLPAVFLGQSVSVMTSTFAIFSLPERHYI
jgi:hypothetical protein